MSGSVMAKSWGKPTVFKNDRDPMFGNGLVMVEGDEWVRQRHVITPAFNPINLKVMASLMVESATNMLDNWTTFINSAKPEIDAEREIIKTAGEIIAKTSFGVSYKTGQKVLEKLRALQVTLFKSNRFVGVPFSKFFCPKKTLEAKRLGKEIDQLFLSIINDRKKSIKGKTPQDLLGILLQGSPVDSRLGKTLSQQELVDECKTFFFGGHETTALAITWTLLLLAMNPEWQDQLRDEIREVVKDGEIDVNTLAGLKKMGWVLNEVLRLYPSAPNLQRQAREDIRVDDLTIPNGTNMWIDLVAMHHDPEQWGLCSSACIAASGCSPACTTGAGKGPQLNAAHGASQYQRQNRGASLSNEDIEDLLESIPLSRSDYTVYTGSDAKWTDGYTWMYTCHS
nr:cytochrome p450 [Quercus suber]